MLVPYGALPGFNLAAEIREVAAHYNAPPRKVRHGDGRAGESVSLARHALFWKLRKQRGLTEIRIAQLLHCSRSAVREGVALHEKRIAEFQTTSGLKAGGKT